MTRINMKNTKISPNSYHLVLKYSLVDMSYYHLKDPQGADYKSEGYLKHPGNAFHHETFRKGELAILFSPLCHYPILNFD